MLVHRSTESLVIERLDIPATESPSVERDSFIFLDEDYWELEHDELSPVKTRPLRSRTMGTMLLWFQQWPQERVHTRVRHSWSEESPEGTCPKKEASDGTHLLLKAGFGNETKERSRGFVCIPIVRIRQAAPDHIGILSNIRISSGHEYRNSSKTALEVPVDHNHKFQQERASPQTSWMKIQSWESTTPKAFLSNKTKNGFMRDMGYWSTIHYGAGESCD